MKKDKRIAKIISNIVIDEVSQCWIWQGSLRDGYGRIRWEGKTIPVHRWFYQWKFGKIIDWVDKTSLELDHICRNRACVNPDHLRLLTAKENVLLGSGPTAINAKKDFCKYGHPLVPDNRGHRRCDICNAIYMVSERRREYKRQYYKEHYAKNVGKDNE